MWIGRDTGRESGEAGGCAWCSWWWCSLVRVRRGVANRGRCCHDRGGNMGAVCGRRACQLRRCAGCAYVLFAQQSPVRMMVGAHNVVIARTFVAVGWHATGDCANERQHTGRRAETSDDTHGPNMRIAEGRVNSLVVMWARRDSLVVPLRHHRTRCSPPVRV